ncbi:N-6 DNA methylase [Glycomyces albus]
MNVASEGAHMEQSGLFEVDKSKDPGPAPLAEDETLCFITERPVKLKGAEPVLQQVARALPYEYGIDLHDMERDFAIPVPTGGKKRTLKADIAVFTPGSEHTLANLERVVVCKPEPKQGRTVTKIRTHEQANGDLDHLRMLLSTDKTPKAHYGMWTNGLDVFFLYAKESRFARKFEFRANWPVEAGSGSQTGASVAKLRRGEAAMLKTAFRRCHNYVHGNEGLPKDAAFWQFLYLLFSKMHDEKVSKRHGSEPRFFALPDEPFKHRGPEAIRDRIQDLFAEVKRTYPLFGARDEITLTPGARLHCRRARLYNLTDTDIDVKGVAYQELVGDNLRGDRGQYFTPRSAVKLTVEILDPKEHETVLDPACGTGGFLQETLRHLMEDLKEEQGVTRHNDTSDKNDARLTRLQKFAQTRLFGCDFDPFLVRATQMSIMMMTGEEGNAYHMNSLAFSGGDRLKEYQFEDEKAAEQTIPFGSIDVLMTNPPFGTDIKIEESEILSQYKDGIAQTWSRNRETGELVSSGPAKAVAPEQLFIERAVKWIRPGGRLGIVLPNGILSNPGPSDEAVRRWILENCWVLASVELPVETFIHEAGVNILTTLLFLKRKSDQEMADAQFGYADTDYPVFMAVAEKVGIDRRGNPVYKRRPDGEIIMELKSEEQPIYRRNQRTTRMVTRWEKQIDNDLPEIAAAYKGFREQHPEPGITR